MNKIRTRICYSCGEEKFMDHELEKKLGTSIPVCPRCILRPFWNWMKSSIMKRQLNPNDVQLGGKKALMFDSAICRSMLVRLRPYNCSIIAIHIHLSYQGPVLTLDQYPFHVKQIDYSIGEQWIACFYLPWTYKSRFLLYYIYSN